MSTYIRKFWKFIKRNETARGLLLVGIVILGALAVWGGVRLALNTEYPVLVVSSGSMCPVTNCVLPIGSLIVIRGQDPSTIIAAPPQLGSIIVFRPYLCQPDYLVVHRVVYEVKGSGYSFVTKGDANGVADSWDARCGTSLSTIMFQNQLASLMPSDHVVGVYQGMIPIPYLGSTILGIRNFMYDDTTGQPRPEGILVIVILIIALFAFEVIEPSKKQKPEASSSEAKAEPAPTQAPASAFQRILVSGGKQVPLMSSLGSVTKGWFFAGLFAIHPEDCSFLSDNEKVIINVQNLVASVT